MPRTRSSYRKKRASKKTMKISQIKPAIVKGATIHAKKILSKVAGLPQKMKGKIAKAISISVGKEIGKEIGKGREFGKGRGRE